MWCEVMWSVSLFLSPTIQYYLSNYVTHHTTPYEATDPHTKVENLGCIFSHHSLLNCSNYTLNPYWNKNNKFIFKEQLSRAILLWVKIRREVGKDRWVLKLMGTLNKQTWTWKYRRIELPGFTPKPIMSNLHLRPIKQGSTRQLLNTCIRAIKKC